MSVVAPRAIITTPNKNRSAFDSVAPTPAFSEHVREWTAGEFYWVLRTFWQKVDLYTIDGFHRQVNAFRQNPDHDPALRVATLCDHEEPLLAVCEQPNGRLWAPPGSLSSV